MNDMNNEILHCPWGWCFARHGLLLFSNLFAVCQRLHIDHLKPKNPLLVRHCRPRSRGLLYYCLLLLRGCFGKDLLYSNSTATGYYYYKTTDGYAVGS